MKFVHHLRVLQPMIECHVLEVHADWAVLALFKSKKIYIEEDPFHLHVTGKFGVI